MMTIPSLGFVGGGRIARILLGGLLRAGGLPERVIVSDVDQKTLDRLHADFPTVEAVYKENGSAARQDLVFLALHPAALGEALSELARNLNPDKTVVSLAPKWTLARLSNSLSGLRRLVRVIPNAPSIVNRGYNPLCFCDGMAHADRDRVRSLFALWGQCPEVPESTLEAYAILSGMGPTYFWHQLYQLAEVSRSLGLEPKAVWPALEAMVIGTLKTMTESGLPPETVMDLVPSKPLAALEATIAEGYSVALPSLYRKLKEWPA
jgi:pyrroline-5-carboxylate reductase